jgi:hypothetical protein
VNSKIICLASMLVLMTVSTGAAETADRGPTFPVGISTRSFVPLDSSYDWRGAQTHALVTTIWYPAKAGSVEKQQWVGPPDAPIASAGKAAPDADLPVSHSLRWPLA